MNADQFNQFLDRVGQGRVQGGAHKLEKFSTGDQAEWITWRASFLLAAEINGWNDLRQRREAKAAMTGVAANHIAHIDIVQVPAITIEDLLNQYEAIFLPEAGQKLSRAEFDSATQGPNETIQNWHNRIRALFRRAFPNVDVDNSRQAIERFIVGLSDPDILFNVHRANPNTFQLAYS